MKMEGYMRRKCMTLLLMLAPVLAFCQTAAEMDAMLTANTVSAAKAVRFVLEAADVLPAGLSGPEAEKTAYDLAASKGWISAAAGDSVTLKETAFLIMKAFDFKGGVMYSLFGNPRYAYREMVYHRLIPGRTDQSMKVSGSRLLAILDRTSRFAGEDESL